ncbi:MAG: methylthioadenosine phosphorylase [Elusimicrobia bacterium GWA2_56_46]|nr:MAG: methylthioadenosine phosphorylase [Elusimicrobia bacterium GWA2_56_46]OGR55906.1 MAG: methylthioadenosine phosphorylase [Elusimicrobia bacterium GWC2_56_31]HBB67561.1 S-methyl-5'-thioadenosine phosphorylase [Elusimicrobiota bacterium]HBW22159.1 S-methyl-5'-thioadenosine phosphorylase [Elusimicrobiota bacterium]
MTKKPVAGTAVIGGSGLYAMKELKGVREIGIKTPFGRPSDSIILGSLAGTPVAFLPRHGRKHAILPGEINHRANMWALKSLGVKTIISASAVGSLKAELAPAHFVFPDQFVDETKGRVSTFFGAGIVGHVPFAEPFCMALSSIMHKEAVKLGIKSHLGGVYVCMEGPGFSTRAESLYHRKLGYSIIGMTVATEAKLAREAGFHYAPVSLVTDYDCWKEGEEVDQEQVTATLKKNVENIRRLLVKVIPMAAGAPCANSCPEFVKTSILTLRENFPPKTYRALKFMI